MATSWKSRAADKDDLDVKKKDLYGVNPLIIEEELGFNLRDYDDPEVIEHIESLCQSYMAGLYVPPPIARIDDDGRVVVIEGHCRIRAIKKAIERGANIPFIDVLPFRGNDAERVQLMLRSAQGLSLKPLKVALGYLRLRRMGHEVAEIAKSMGKSTAHVEQMLVLANANSDVHALVSSGAVNTYAAIEVVRKHGEKAGAVLQDLINGNEGKAKKVVTRSDVNEWIPPRKIIGNIYKSVDGFVDTFDKNVRVRLAELEKLDAEELRNKTIEVDAASLLEIFRSWSKADEAKKSKLEAGLKRKEKASQMDLAGTEEGDEEK